MQHTSSKVTDKIETTKKYLCNRESGTEIKNNALNNKLKNHTLSTNSAYERGK